MKFEIPRVQLIINNNNIVQVSYLMIFDFITSVGLFIRQEKHQVSASIRNKAEISQDDYCLMFNCYKIPSS